MNDNQNRRWTTHAGVHRTAHLEAFRLNLTADTEENIVPPCGKGVAPSHERECLRLNPRPEGSCEKYGSDGVQNSGQEVNLPLIEIMPQLDIPPGHRLPSLMFWCLHEKPTSGVSFPDVNSWNDTYVDMVSLVFLQG